MNQSTPSDNAPDPSHVGLPPHLQRLEAKLRRAAPTPTTTLDADAILHLANKANPSPGRDSVRKMSYWAAAAVWLAGVAAGAMGMWVVREWGPGESGDARTGQAVALQNATNDNESQPADKPPPAPNSESPAQVSDRAARSQPGTRRVGESPRDDVQCPGESVDEAAWRAAHGQRLSTPRRPIRRRRHRLSFHDHTRCTGIPTADVAGNATRDADAVSRWRDQESVPRDGRNSAQREAKRNPG